MVLLFILKLLLVLIYMKKQMSPHKWKSCVLPISEKTAFSFGQTYPLKKGVEGDIDFFLP